MINRIIIAMLASFAISITLLGADPPAARPATKTRNMMSNCQAINKSIDNTTKAIDEATRSNDPEKMKAAPNQAQKQLAERRQYVSRCTEMMGMM